MLHPCIPFCNMPVVGYAGDIKKAKEGGYHTCESLLMYPRKVGDAAILSQLAIQFYRA